MLSRYPNATPEKINPVDVHVGRRLRARRLEMKISQEKLAGAIGVTYQQVQKYEKGINRVGASRLQLIAIALQAPVSHFFDEMPDDAGEISADPKVRLHAEIMKFATSDEGIELIRTFTGIEDATVRKRALGVLKALGEGTG
ncbi:helix-turn-helix transcriptional regulator [Rhizobium sp. 1AS11]|uniref:helix-turn-helix domain-containing protein n=1 Tax=Rhizobium acaciae TaxID=2989736 RepID=UPI00222349A6|nr:helix-turn-helix transcriptional regulator [Rhizobium acaciae]MCW1413355.1 helix-turn-helix transcriptional regulator [Rhizobium acaciae]MCW1745505.1 helix-turn-helix transcriptional regulator [Rhizobium acaciae]